MTKKRTKEYYGYLEGIVSVIGNLLLFGLKYWAGIVSGSVALIADAWHTLSDTVSSFMVITGVKLSSKSADSKHPYGYGRWEEITSIFISILLAIVAYEFIRESIDKLYSRESANYGTIAIVVTIVSIAAKEGMAQYAFRLGKISDLSSVKADAWHHRTDALSSVIILIGIFLEPFIWWIDSALGIIVSLMIFYAAYEIIKDAVNKILGEQPSEALKNAVVTVSRDISGKELRPHHFHLHNYGRHSELTFHIYIDDEMDIKSAHNLATKIEKEIYRQKGIHTTIHIEPECIAKDKIT